MAPDPPVCRRSKINNQQATGASKVGSGWQESITDHRTTTAGDNKQCDHAADVCVNLSFGEWGPFSILRLTKACLTCPPPRNLITVIKAKLRPTQNRPSPSTHQTNSSPMQERVDYGTSGRSKSIGCSHHQQCGTGPLLCWKCRHHVGDFFPPKQQTCRHVGAMSPTRHRPCRQHCTVSACRTSCRCRVGLRKL
jgi:hypothetical protein